MSQTQSPPLAASGRRHAAATSRGSASIALPRLHRRGLAVLLLTVFGAGALATLAMWWQDNAAGSVRNLGDLLVAGGRVTGLLGAYLLLAEVALMARVPWVERKIGADWLTAAHRALGSYLVTLLTAHALLLIGGYSIGEQVSFATETGRIIRQYEDVLSATVALGLLIGIGVISARVVRRRLPYEAWHGLHLSAYAAVWLAFGHQFAVGADFSTSPVARAVWTGAHLLVLAAVLTFRVGHPLLMAWRHRLRVQAVVPEGPGTVSILVTGRNLDRLRAESGQFFRWRFLTSRTWWQAHPFSLSAPPDTNGLRLTVKTLGDHTRALQELAPGTRVFAEGPYGAFTAALRTRRKVLLLAAGVGITPLRALFESLDGGPGDVVLLYRASSRPDVIFAEELQRLAEQRRSPVHVVLGRRGDGRPDPLDAAGLRARVPDVARRDVFLCGPPGMLTAATRELRAAGVPQRRIHSERFDM